LPGGKWKPVILVHIKDGPKHYAELRRRVPMLSDMVLTHRLHDLVTLGFIQRRDDGPASRYALTADGEWLRPLLESPE
jgi:DNA-binding HxlR family transcriptional regulator